MTLPIHQITAHPKSVWHERKSKLKYIPCIGVIAFAIAAISVSQVRAQELFLTSGVSTINSEFDLVYVGFDSNGNTADPGSNEPYVATANLVDGADVGIVYGFNTSTINVTGGSTLISYLFGDSTINISGGKIISAIQLRSMTATASIDGTDLAYQYLGYSTSDHADIFGVSGILEDGTVLDGSIINGASNLLFIAVYDIVDIGGNPTPRQFSFNGVNVEPVAVPESRPVSLFGLSLVILSVSPLVRRRNLREFA